MSSSGARTHAHQGKTIADKSSARVDAGIRHGIAIQTRKISPGAWGLNFQKYSVWGLALGSLRCRIWLTGDMLCVAMIHMWPLGSPWHMDSPCLTPLFAHIQIVAKDFWLKAMPATVGKYFKKSRKNGQALKFLI